MFADRQSHGAHMATSFDMSTQLDDETLEGLAPPSSWGHLGQTKASAGGRTAINLTDQLLTIRSSIMQSIAVQNVANPETQEYSSETADDGAKATQLKA